jgi:pyruvoyl-dependent arginine decarboxylase (PvlArgDC)
MPMNDIEISRGLPVMVANRLFLTTGFGQDQEHKNARDHASDPAGVADLTLIAGSSALPAGIKIIDRDEFNAAVTFGQEVIAIHGYCESNVPGQIINSTLSVILPVDGNGKGSVAELFEWPGLDPDAAIRRTERMAIKLYAERNGNKGFDPGSVWEQGRTSYTLAGKDVYIYTIQAGGTVSDDGEWACALAAAVLL